MAVDLQNNFQLSYVWLKGKKSLFSKIKTIAKSAESIYLGTDPDREGELIAYHLWEELSSLKKPIYRSRFFEITKKHILQEIQTPAKLSFPLVHSQMARRTVDRLYGYTVSPRLWKDLKIDQLSAGRVQSTVLQWICEREEKIRNFIPEPYSILTAIAETKEKETVPLVFLPRDESLLQREEALSILKDYGCSGPGTAIPGTSLVFEKENRKPHKVSSPRPFTTATLQEASSRVLGLSPQETLKIASSLYEGIEIPGNGLQGLITYIRTDSTRVSPDKILVGQSLLKEMGFQEFRISSGKRTQANQFSQEAHEAVVPIDPKITPESLQGILSRSELSLYRLVWKRFLESLLPDETGFLVIRDFGNKGHIFRHTFVSISELGFKRLDSQAKPLKDPFLKLKIGEKISIVRWELENKKTNAPIRFTEGAIVQKMESTGIGRPSTYAPTLQTLLKRKYIHVIKKNIHANPLGEKVSAYLTEQIPELLGVGFTKELEGLLDQIATGHREKDPVIKDFFLALQKSLSKKPKPSVLATTSITQNHAQSCPECGEGFVQKKKDKKGEIILYCSRFPHCDYAERH